MAARSNASGMCPYCQRTVFSSGTERRPGQLVQQCQNITCGGYSVLNTRNGARYPLADKTNPDSVPHT
jgi:hypothetical protein